MKKKITDGSRSPTRSPTRSPNKTKSKSNTAVAKKKVEVKAATKKRELLSDKYTETELRQALASLDPDHPDNELNVTRGHIYGYNRRHSATENTTVGEDGGVAESFFVDDHELSTLQEITAHRILEYDTLLRNPKTPSIQALLTTAATFRTTHGPPINLLHQIRHQHPSMALAAEFKRASPSKGSILPPCEVPHKHPQGEAAVAGKQAMIYARAGACVISILTEPMWFQGSLADLTLARIQTTNWAATTSPLGVAKLRLSKAKPAVDGSSGSSSPTSSKGSSGRTHGMGHMKGQVRRPAILRKDFITSEYQIAEAAAVGADSVQLIVAVVPATLLETLITFAREECGMEPLVEVHTAEELDVALGAGAKILGVNNRNLHTMVVDLGTTERMAARLEEKKLDYRHRSGNNDDGYSLCALSGTRTAEDVERYRKVGVGMCLIGESLMRAVDPGASIDALCLDPEAYKALLAEDEDEEEVKSEAKVIQPYTGGTKLVKVCGITNATDATTACKAGANLIGVVFAAKSKRCVNQDSARAVVKAVHTFGERNGRYDPLTSTANAQVVSPPTAPLANLLFKSKRLEVASQTQPLVVGVFQNQNEDYVQRMVKECGLDMVQLHGKEWMETATPAKCGGVPVIRVVEIEVNPGGSDNANGNNSGTGEGITGEGDEDASDPNVDKILGALTTDPIAILVDTKIRSKKKAGGTGVAFDYTIAEKLQSTGLPVIVTGGMNPGNVAGIVKKTNMWGVDVSSGVESRPGRKDGVKVGAFMKAVKAAAGVEASKVV